MLEFTSSGPRLEVVYTDPLLAQSVDLLDAELDQSLQLMLAPGTCDAAGIGAAARRGRNASRSPAPTMERMAGSLPPTGDLWRPRPSRCLSFGLYLSYSRHKAQDAATLLAEAARQENAPIANGHVVHRVIEFDVTSEDGKQAIQSGTISIWKNPGRSQLAMRLSSRDGKLLAGVWKAADGSYAVYRDGKLADHAAAPANLGDVVAPEDSEDLWMNEPAAGRFQALAGGQGALTAHPAGADSVVEYRPTSTPANANSSHLVRAALTLRAGRHVVGEVLWIGSGGEVRRVSYREVDYTEREGDGLGLRSVLPRTVGSRGATLLSTCAVVLRSPPMPRSWPI